MNKERMMNQQRGIKGRVVYYTRRVHHRTRRYILYWMKRDLCWPNFLFQHSFFDTTLPLQWALQKNPLLQQQQQQRQLKISLLINWLLFVNVMQRKPRHWKPRSRHYSNQLKRRPKQRKEKWTLGSVTCSRNCSSSMTRKYVNWRYDMRWGEGKKRGIVLVCVMDCSLLHVE